MTDIAPHSAGAAARMSHRLRRIINSVPQYGFLHFMLLIYQIFSAYLPDHSQAATTRKNSSATI